MVTSNGHYLVGIYASSDKTYELPVHDGFGQAIDLTKHKKIGGTKVLSVLPQTTVVLALP